VSAGPCICSSRGASLLPRRRPRLHARAPA
jgi:hypothetical protein